MKCGASWKHRSNKQTSETTISLSVATFHLECERRRAAAKENRITLRDNLTADCTEKESCAEKREDLASTKSAVASLPVIMQS